MLRQGRIDSETNRDLGGLPKMITLDDDTLTYSMKPSDFIIIVDTTSVTGDGVAIVTLPSLAEACGKGMYLIKAPAGSTGGDLSVYEKETGTEYSTYGDLDADNDQVGLVSNGVEWIVVYDGVA